MITLGIYLPWFIRNTERFRLQHTSFQGQRIHFNLEASELLVYAIVAYFGTLLTLGLAGPWMLNWGLKLFINNIEIDGNLALDQVTAVASDGSAMGDDLAVAYDIDLGF